MEDIPGGICLLGRRLWMVLLGVWQVLKKPVHSVILAQIAGHLSIGLLIGALIQGFLYLSLAGGIWCVGYMISEYFKESK